MLKKNLRKKILKIRKKNYSVSKNINFLELVKILKNKEIKKASIGGYFPVNYEIDCLKILEKLSNVGFEICLPSIKKNNQMEFYTWSFKDPLVISKFGIPEPLSKNKVYPDVLIVPILSFDHLKYRLGYGGGYYDRYLEKIGKIKNHFTVGFSFSFQKIAKIPKNKYDKKLDYILTEKYLI